MEQLRKILVATDFSGHAQRAEIRAAMLGIALKCEILEILAVKNPKSRDVSVSTEDRGLATDAIAPAAVTERDPGTLAARLQERDRLTCIRSVRFGQPVTEILARADELAADLTVVGAHGGNFFTDFFLGYSIDKLVRMSKRPLLIVKNHPHGAYNKVLVAVDFSGESREAARMALEIAPTAQIAFLHACHVPDEGQMREVGIPENIIQGYRANAAEKARRHLDQFIADLAPGRQVLFRAVHHGSPVPVLCNYARKIGPDLIAMGKHGRSRFEELMLGSVTRRMMDQTSCDFLVASAPGHAGG